MRLEGLGQLKNPMTSSGIEAATFPKCKELVSLIQMGLLQLREYFCCIQLPSGELGMAQVTVALCCKLRGKTDPALLLDSSLETRSLRGMGS
jgi:hypothetical protein